MVSTECLPAGEPGSTEAEWQPGGQDLRELAIQLRLLLDSGLAFAIATVVGARGTPLRRLGTVVALSESGQAIGVNPAGPLDGAITGLAAEALRTGQDRLGRLEIDHEAASYVGLSGAVSLDVHTSRVRAGDPMFDSALRYLDSGAAIVLVIGTCGVSGHVVIGPDRVAGRLSCPKLPTQLLQDARGMLGSRRAAHRTYRLGGETGSVGIQVWMQSHPECDIHAPGPSAQPDRPGMAQAGPGRMVRPRLALLSRRLGSRGVGVHADDAVGGDVRPLLETNGRLGEVQRPVRGYWAGWSAATVVVNERRR
jgi:XdhC and CoxI family